MDNEKILDISWGTIWKILIAVICFYILYQIADILVWFIFALVISILFNPAIDFLRKFKIPRVLAVCFVYILFFGILILIVYLITPLFISEIKQFSQVFPQYFEKASPLLKEIGITAFRDFDTFINTLSEILEKITTNIFNILFVIFGGILATIFILSVAIYISLEEKGVEKFLILFFPKKYENYVLALWGKCQKKVSSWFLTRILSCLFVGLFSFVAFLILKTPYPFSLGVLAGIFNFIPIVGPILTAIFLFIIIALENILKAVFALIVFTLIQQIENNILTPFLSKKFIGLSPVLVLMALAIGGTLWGFLGSILAIPLAGIAFEFIRDFLKKKKEDDISSPTQPSPSGGTKKSIIW